MFGSHLSISKGLHDAVTQAVALGLDTVQVFSKNQQQWRAKPLEEAAIQAYRDAIGQAGFACSVAHDSYLINLASPDPLLRQKSIELFEEEIRRCELLGIAYLVTHPGAHMGKRDNPDDERAGLERVAEALCGLLDRFPKGRTTVCLESTAGQGSGLGRTLEELAFIINACPASHRKRLGVCLDTAHLFAAGYDFRGRKYSGFKKQLEATLGLDRVKVWHLNDSKKPLGSRVDRHEHIGHGTIGLDGFSPIVRDKAWQLVPKILEMPKEKHENGQEWDLVNTQTLRSLLK